MKTQETVISINDHESYKLIDRWVWLIYLKDSSSSSEITAYELHL